MHINLADFLVSGGKKRKFLFMLLLTGYLPDGKGLQ